MVGTKIREEAGRLEVDFNQNGSVAVAVTQRTDGGLSLHTNQVRDSSPQLLSGEERLLFSARLESDTKPEYPDLARPTRPPRTVEPTGRGKLRVDLVPMEAIEAMAQIMGWSGSSKYEDWDWLTKYTVEDCWGSAMRHMIAWKKGERADPESGHNHLYHALTRLGMAAYFQKNGEPKPP
jgi:hypothetical protein